MQDLNRKTIINLLESQVGPCVSIYMPTHRAGPETRQDPIQLKNLVRQAEKDLANQYPEYNEAQELFKQAWALVDDLKFWQHQLDGLAIFAASGVFQANRLPRTFEANVTVADSFNVVPLMPLLALEGEFYLLALNQKDTRLYHGNQLDLVEMELEDTPTSLEQALRFDNPEAQLQFYTSTGPHPSSSGGERRAIYHGHGGASADEDTNLRRFFHQLNDGVHRKLRDQEAPLLLAGVGYELPIYQEVNTYPKLVEDAITVNPHELELDELHELAWQIVESIFLLEQENSLERYRNLHATQMTGTAIDEIVPAAVSGRIETLFVQEGTRIWGTYQPESHSVQVHQDRQVEDMDLIELAVAQTYENGGMVYVLDADSMPPRTQTAAIFRYTFQNQEV